MPLSGDQPQNFVEGNLKTRCGIHGNTHHRLPEAPCDYIRKHAEIPETRCKDHLKHAAEKHRKCPPGTVRVLSEYIADALQARCGYPQNTLQVLSRPVAATLKTRCLQMLCGYLWKFCEDLQNSGGVPGDRGRVKEG